jgi:hypothetical protein
MSPLLSASSAYSRAYSTYQLPPSSMCQTKSPSPGFKMYSPLPGGHGAPFLSASAVDPDPFLTPPALNGRAFGYAHASQSWRNGVDEARVDWITSASQGGLSASPSSDIGNYQAQLDSVPDARHAAVPRQPREYLEAPQLHFETSSSGVTNSALHPVQQNLGSAFTVNSGVARPDQFLGKRPRPQPVVPLLQQRPVKEIRPRLTGAVVPTTARFPPVQDHEDLDRSLQMEMDIIEDIDNHTPNFGLPNPRVLLGKRSYGYGTTPGSSSSGTSSSHAHDSMSSAKRPRQSSAKSPITINDEVSSICSRQPEPNCDSWASQSPFLTRAEELGMSVTPEQEPPFTKSHRDWIMDGFPSRQPFCLSGILLNAFP